MQKTGNYGLNKPEYNNVADIVPAVCDNMDIIDQNLKRIDDKVGNLNLDAANVSFASSIAAFTQKNVKAALDYLFQLANNGKQYWVDVVGWPLAITDTFATLRDKTQAIKNIIAGNITSKGVPANGTDSLKNLADAIERISIQSLGGYKFATGICTSSYNNVYEWYNVYGGTYFGDSGGKYPFSGSVNITGFDFIPKFGIIKQTNKNGKDGLVAVTYLDGMVLIPSNMYRMFSKDENSNIIASYGRLKIPVGGLNIGSIPNSDWELTYYIFG